MRTLMFAAALVIAWWVTAAIAFGVLVGLLVYGAGRWFTDGREAVREMERREPRWRLDHDALDEEMERRAQELRYWDRRR